MKIANATAGPWQLEVDRQAVLSRSVIRFDPAGIYPGSVTRTVADHHDRIEVVGAGFQLAALGGGKLLHPKGNPK